MRIAFFGLPLAALALEREGHELAIAAVCRKGAPGTRRLRRKLGDARVLVRPNAMDARFVERIRALQVDLVVSWFWTTKIPSALVACARLGGFGVHPSLLPRWRGPDPCFWAIDAGDAETGVTAHRLDAQYDTGAMLGQRAIAIEPTWNAWELARALDRPSLALLVETARAFGAGTLPRELAQDASLATEAPSPSEAMLEIEWGCDAASIVRRVRAAAPYPGAWTFIGDEALVLTRAEETRAPPGLVAGEAALIEGVAVVASGRGGVALLDGRVVMDDDRERAVDKSGIAALMASASAK